MSGKIIGVKHHLSSGCCMCSGIEDLYATRTNISITEYMGKVPKVPNQIMGVKEADIPYCANYDRLAGIIHEL